MRSTRAWTAAAVAGGAVIALSAATLGVAASAAVAAIPPIELISASYNGFTGDDGTSSSAISGDGRYVVFLSSADNILPDPYSGFVYLRDRVTRTSTPVAVSSTGQYGNDGGYYAAISGNGRYIAFNSQASNLVPGDTQGVSDIFVRDVQSKTTTRISVSSSGVPANQGSDQNAISADGRFVAYLSDATNLVGGDTNGTKDLFVYDRSDRTTRRAGVSSSGVQPNAAVVDPSISGNGRYVGFWSAASNLVPGDTNGVADAFVHDLRTGATTRVTLSSAGVQANAGRGAVAPGAPVLSSDGRYVAFASAASNLVPGDTDGVADVFVRDLVAGTTTLLSRSSSGTLGNGDSFTPSISADGHYVAFASAASNLVSGDTNGVADIFLRDLGTGQVTRQNVTPAGEQADVWSYGSHLSADGGIVAFTSGADNLVTGDFNDDFDIFARPTGPPGH